MKAVVFDIGNVLVQWDPHLAWLEEMGSREAVAEFLTRINFPERNLRADGGEMFADLAAELDNAEDRQRLSVYVERYARTVPQKIEGTWQVLYRLKEKGTPVHAITNWSAETWPEGLKMHPRLGEVFDALVVSGQEGIIKPDARIFHLLCERADTVPEACIFIDDGLHNVAGARAVGMDGIHFTSPVGLETALIERGLL